MVKGMINRKTVDPIVLHAVLIIGVVLMIVPFLWMILTAFKSISESTQLDPFIIFPRIWRTAAFKSVIAKMDFFRLYWNTFVTAFGTFLLRQSFMTLPKDLEQAALLDSCNIGKQAVTARKRL